MSGLTNFDDWNAHGWESQPASVHIDNDSYQPWTSSWNSPAFGSESSLFESKPVMSNYFKRTAMSKVTPQSSFFEKTRPAKSELAAAPASQLRTAAETSGVGVKRVVIRASSEEHLSANR